MKCNNQSRPAGSRYDVIVVGAGPGGATAAHYLARGGARVLLLERSQFPRDKACGDAVSVDALDLLVDMGLKGALGRWLAWEACLLTSPRGHRALCRGSARVDGLHGVIAPRREFDQALVERAVAEGAELWERCVARGALLEDGRCVGVIAAVRDGPEQELRAPVVIAADGHHSAIARSFGLEHRAEVTAFAVRGYFELKTITREPRRAIELHLDRRLLPGYGWYFPVSDRMANVGIGILKVPMQKRGLTLDRLFEEFVTQNPFVAERLAGARRIGRLRGAPLPMGPGPSYTRRGSCLFIGDAAGFVDALTGEGIAAAMHTGHAAAEVVLAALGAERLEPQAFKEYDRRWRHRYGASLRAASRLQRVMGGGFLIDRLVDRAQRRPALGATIFDAVAGIVPKTVMLRPANLLRVLL